MADELISLSDGPEIQTPDLISLKDENKAVLPEDTVASRAEKANFGLKELSPGVDSLKNTIGRGDENYARESAATAVDLKDRQTKLTMIQQIAASNNGAVKPEELNLVRALTAPNATHPSVVFEAEYAREYFNRLALSKESENSVVQKALAENEPAALDEIQGGTNILTRQETVRTKIEDLESRWKQAGLWESVGTYLEQIVPFKSWANTVKAMEGFPMDRYNLPGGSMDNRAQQMWLLPPKQFKEQLDKDVDKIAESNLIDAINYANAILSFPSSDQFVQNVFGVMDITDVGAVAAGLARGAKGLVRGAAKAPSTEAQLKKAVKDVIDSTAAGVKPERALEIVGETQKATEVKAIQKVLSDQVDAAVQESDRFRAIKSVVSSIDRPTEVLDNSGRLTNASAARLSEKLVSNAELLTKAVLDPAMAERLTAEGLAKAAKEVGTELYREFKYLNDSILDIVRNPRRAETNTDSMSIRLGTTDAQPFEDYDVAYSTARDMYGLPKEVFTVKQEGPNWFIDIERALDETNPNVRDIVNTNNTVPKAKYLASQLMDQFLGRIRSPAETSSPLNKANKNVVLFAQEASLKFVKEVAQDIKALTKRERPDFDRILTLNRESKDSAGDRGIFYKNVGELDTAYLQNFGRLPSERETQAYFSYVQMSDYDWILRNTTMLRDKERMGLKKFTFEIEPLQDASSMFGVSYKTNTPAFEGKKVSSIPWSSDHLSVLVYDPVTKTTQTLSRRAASESKLMVDTMVKEGGYQIVQIANPVGRPLKAALGTNEPVQYVVTKAFTQSELDLKQVGYRPGGHVVYKGEYWVKQPKLYQGEGGTWFYEGDKTAFNFTSRAQANKFSDAMEKGRQLLKNKDMKGLADHLKESLPYSPQSFKKLFSTEGYYDINQSFKSVRSGERIGDTLDTTKYPSYRDLTKGEYNLTDELDRTFTGEKSDEGFTIKERGTDEHPVYELTTAPLVDPMSTLARSIGQATRSRHFGDMKISAAEQFIQEFHPAMIQSLEELRKFPMYYLHNPSWNPKADAAVLAQAKYTQANAMRFIGQSSDYNKTFEWLKAKLLDRAYKIDGEGQAEILSQSALMTSRDPTSYFRNVAFHLKLGLYNVSQWFVQGQGLSVVAAVSPANFLPAMSGYTLMRMGPMINSTAEILEGAAQRAAKMGWKREQFIEAYQTMTKSGWNDVGRESALMDDMSDPKLFQGTAGTYLNKAAVIFNEAERMVRMAAWNASYLEFRKAQPTKALSNRDIGEIMSRADTLSVNMTRASKTQLETGLMSIPAQFASYQARMLDLFWGKQLTKGEKASLFGVNAMLYGVPTSVAGATGYAWYEDVKQWAIENDFGSWEPMVNMMVEGLPAMAISAITGEDYNIAQRYGPGGFGFVRDFMNGDKDAIDIALGVSGGAIKDIVGSASAVVGGLTEVFENDGTFEPVVSDLIDATRAITSVNTAIRMAMALNTGKYITKNEVYLGDMSTFDSIFSAITGLSPREVSDAFLMSRSLAGQKELEKSAEEQFVKYYRRGMEEGSNGNDKAMESYFKRARSFLIVADIQPDKYGAILKHALNGQSSVAQRIGERWIKQAPASKQAQRLEKSSQAARAIQQGNR